MWWLSGIFRDVELYSEPICGVEDIKIVTNLDNEYIDATLKRGELVRKKFQRGET